MNILSVSDFTVPELENNFNKNKFPKIDLIISCGDLQPEYLTFLYSSFNVPLFYVRGNHDIRYKTRPPGGCEDIDQKIVRFNDHNFLGLEGSNWYNGGPVQYTERQMNAKIWSLKPKIWFKKGIDIVVTHAPPRHIHDAEDRCHQGFVCFRRLIEKYKPMFFLHGHIHAEFSNPSERETVFEETKVVNTCGMNIITI